MKIKTCVSFPFSLLVFLSLSASVEDPSSELEERALTPLPDAKRCEGEEGGNTEHGHNANKCHAPEEREHKATRQQNHGETKDKQGHIRTEDRTAEIRNVQKETQPVTFKKHNLNDNTGRCGQQGQSVRAKSFHRVS